MSNVLPFVGTAPDPGRKMIAGSSGAPESTANHEPSAALAPVDASRTQERSSDRRVTVTVTPAADGT